MADEPRNNDTHDDETPTQRMTSGDPLAGGHESVGAGGHESAGAGGDESAGAGGHESAGAGGDEPPRAGGHEPSGAGGDEPPGPRRLTRSGSNSVIGGVAGGLGRYFNVDPILFRIGFVALTFAGGIGVIAYLALLAFVPSDGETRTGGTSRVAAIAGAVVLGLALITFLDGPFFFGPGLLFLAVVGVAAFLLWRGFGGGEGSDPARTLARIALACVVAFGVVIAAIGVGIAAALGGGVVIASLAVVAGLALIAAAFAGGARWLILPALVLVLPLAIVAAADIDFDGGIGDRYHRPATMAELDDRYEVGLGELDVDLRDLELPAGRTDLTVDVGMGDAVVWVPREACVTSNVDIGMGGADVLDRDDAGVDVSFVTAATPTSGRPHLHIDADVGVGVVEVVREGFRPDWADHDRGFGRERFRYDGGADEVDAAETTLNCA